MTGRELFFFQKCKSHAPFVLPWSLADHMTVQCFSVDQSFQTYNKDDFVSDFFQDPVVTSTLKVLSSGGEWTVLGCKVQQAIAEELYCTQVTLNFFDRLAAVGVTRDNGRLVKRLDEPCGDFLISDRLREMLLMPDSELAETYSEREKKEFLYVLFRHLCLGGVVCQFEDVIDPYFDITKDIYKELIGVVKDSDTKSIRITSAVYRITAYDKHGSCYPSPREHEQNFAYLILDPSKHQATVLYHCYGTKTGW
uniref:cilia- and flagella-associated protein 300-like isoform X2 n=1 Tax=Myxine glutinosa TaxID=7769 RepID=UPI00358E92BE